MLATKMSGLFFIFALATSTTFSGGCCSKHESDRCAECGYRIDSNDLIISATEICRHPRYNVRFHIHCFLKLRQENPRKLIAICGARPQSALRIIKNIQECDSQRYIPDFRFTVFLLLLELQRNKQSEITHFQPDSTDCHEPPSPT